MAKVEGDVDGKVKALKIAVDNWKAAALGALDGRRVMAAGVAGRAPLTIADVAVEQERLEWVRLDTELGSRLGWQYVEKEQLKHVLAESGALMMPRCQDLTNANGLTTPNDRKTCSTHCQWKLCSGGDAGIGRCSGGALSKAMEAAPWCTCCSDEWAQYDRRLDELYANSYNGGCRTDFNDKVSEALDPFASTDDEESKATCANPRCASASQLPQWNVRCQLLHEVSSMDAARAVKKNLKSLAASPPDESKYALLLPEEKAGHLGIDPTDRCAYDPMGSSEATAFVAAWRHVQMEGPPLLHAMSEAKLETVLQKRTELHNRILSLDAVERLLLDDVALHANNLPLISTGKWKIFPHLFDASAPVGGGDGGVAAVAPCGAPQAANGEYAQEEARWQWLDSGGWVDFERDALAEVTKAWDAHRKTRCDLKLDKRKERRATARRLCGGSSSAPARSPRRRMGWCWPRLEWTADPFAVVEDGVKVGCARVGEEATKCKDLGSGEARASLPCALGGTAGGASGRGSCAPEQRKQCWRHAELPAEEKDALQKMIIETEPSKTTGPGAVYDTVEAQCAWLAAPAKGSNLERERWMAEQLQQEEGEAQTRQERRRSKARSQAGQGGARVDDGDQAGLARVWSRAPSRCRSSLTSSTSRRCARVARGSLRRALCCESANTFSTKRRSRSASTRCARPSAAGSSAPGGRRAARPT